MSDLNLTLNETEKNLQSINLLQTLERFFTVAAFYPADHSQCRNALLEFHKAIDLVVPTNENIIIEPGDEGMVLQGNFIEESNSGNQSLNNLLNSLGISQLELPRNAPLEVLHRAVRNFNLLKLESDSSLEFHSMDFSSLPSLVVVTQREFHNRDNILKPSPQSLKRAGEQKTGESKIKSHPSNIASPQIDTTHYSISISDLKTKKLQNDARADIMDLSCQDKSVEMLHVCLQIIRQRNSQQGASPGSSINRHLNKILGSPIEPEKTLILESTITDLITSADRRPIDKLLPWILTPLLHNDSKRFIHFLDRLLPEYQPEKIALIWPHLVGIMLEPKQPQNRKAAQTILSLIGKISEDCRQTEAHRLDLLPVVQAGKFGPGIFQADPLLSHEALLSLMDCRQSQTTGNLLNKCWQKNPPSSLVAVLVRLLGPYEKSQRSIYRGLLKSHSRNGLSSAYKNEFSKLIVTSLMGLTPNQRKEIWAVQAITELGGLQCIESLPALNKILNQKKMLVFKSWSDSCRQAATKTLEQIQHKQAGKTP